MLLSLLNTHAYDAIISTEYTCYYLYWTYMLLSLLNLHAITNLYCTSLHQQHWTQDRLTWLPVWKGSHQTLVWGVQETCGLHTDSLNTCTTHNKLHAGRLGTDWVTRESPTPPAMTQLTRVASSQPKPAALGQSKAHCDTWPRLWAS